MRTGWGEATASQRAGIELPQSETLAQRVRVFGGEVRGLEPERSIRRLVSPQDAQGSDDLLLLNHARYVALAREAPGVVLAPPHLGPRLSRAWEHENPTWVLTQLLLRVVEADPDGDWGSTASAATEARVARTAVVHPTANLHASVVVEPGAVVFPRVFVAEGVVIGAGSVVGRPGFGWALGPNGAQRIPQLAGVVLEAGVELGANCTVDAGCLRATRIGAGTKLDAQVHVGHNAQLGAGCLVAAQCGFAGSCEVGDGVRVGGQSGVADHVRVGDGAQIAAKTGVIRDVPAGEVVAGFPAVSRSRWLRSMAKLFSGR